MITKIPEIEFNFCNLCGADCFVCSKPHGNKNVPVMDKDVFNTAIRQLKDIDFNIIHLGGNGDCFLNLDFMDYLREIKKVFPDKKTVLHSNFQLLNKRRADMIIEEDLLTELHTRIDTVNEDTFRKSTKLRMNDIFKNIDYFMKENKKTDFYIGYIDISKYYEICERVLGTKPYYSPFTDEEINKMGDELFGIKIRFGARAKYSRIAISLWAERANPEIPEVYTPCPKEFCALPEIIWICPNGDINVCGYDDTQGIFTAGNILKEHMADIWKGEKRKEILEVIAKGYQKYPCNNVRCCEFYTTN